MLVNLRRAFEPLETGLSSDFFIRVWFAEVADECFFFFELSLLRVCLSREDGFTCNSVDDELNSLKLAL